VRTALTVIAVVGTVVGAAAGLYFGWQLGQFYAVHRESERRYEADCALAAPVLAADPGFHQVVTFNFPVAGFCLGGPVPTQDDYDRLRAAMLRLFGEPRIGHVMQDVWVERADEPGGQ